LTKDRISDLDENSEPESREVPTSVTYSYVAAAAAANWLKEQLRQEGEQPSHSVRKSSSTSKDKHSQKEPSSHSKKRSSRMTLPRTPDTTRSNNASNKRQKTASVADDDDSSSSERPEPDTVVSTSVRIAQPPPVYPGGYMQPDGITYYGDCFIVNPDGTFDL